MALLAAVIAALAPASPPEAAEEQRAGPGAGGEAQPAADAAKPEEPAEVPELPSRIEFTVRGGIAGFDLVLTIERGGTARLVEHRTLAVTDTLAAAPRQQLARLVAAAGTAVPAADSLEVGDGTGVADGWVRTLRVQDGDHGWSVRERTDPDAALPPEVQPLFERLMEIAMRLKAVAAGHEPLTREAP
jgi:hypothetical protein